ncbi:MAG: hypothetical protein NC038_01190 [Paludibacter sp.]|nr:hypothetical protein [Bacteroidales bacterium]MCM1068823.1 hypothetical protein [Prevotella sp.]MCM1353084.1 hypothetical protein [Bacteroides sp.]MCM1442406.1 hypothetical protein [Muribaculum sp.]MCM1481249.1 hypothetical protein [Paludibacter sp.]
MIATVLNTLTQTLSDLQTKITTCWNAVTGKGVSVPSNVTRNLSNLPAYIGKLVNPTGSISITANGTHDVSKYAQAVVAVPQTVVTPSTSEAAHAIEAWYGNEPLDINDAMQIDVNQDNIEMYNDMYVGSAVVYIGTIRLPDELLCITERDPATSTEFCGWRDCPELRYIGTIYQESYPDCTIPPGIVYDWFANSLQEQDPNKPLYWAGIANWGMGFDLLKEQFGDIFGDPEIGEMCINLSHLNLTPYCIMQFYSNLYDLSQNATYYALVVTWEQECMFDDYLQQRGIDSFGALFAQKGWGVMTI